MHSSYLFQRLISEVFWVFIQKFGDVFMIRNKWQELNSALHQLAQGDTGFLYSILLKVTGFQKPLNFWNTEDLLYTEVHRGKPDFVSSGSWWANKGRPILFLEVLLSGPPAQSDTREMLHSWPGECHGGQPI